MKGSDNKDYELLEKEFVNFKSLQAAQKQRGLNDFNVFTTLLSKHDEVRLHSRFIASLLDVSGLHYQGTLFLDLFLQLFGPTGFEFDAENCQCFREYRNIDVYLTDGNNHIIVENKIYATDQKTQAQRYIETIVQENPDVEEFQVWFCYLSVNRTQPSASSLGIFTLSNNKTHLASKQRSVLYSNVHYKTDIPRWLDLCLKEVANLKDLSVSIEQYQRVVSQINRSYKSKVMNLEAYLNTLSEGQKKAFLTTLISASKEIPIVRLTMMESFFEKLQDRIRNNQKLPEGWEVNVNGGVSRLKEKNGFPLRVSFADNPLIIGLEFKSDAFTGLRIGVVRKTKYFDIKVFIASRFCEEAISDNVSRSKHSKWWLDKIDLIEFKGSLWSKIIEEGEEPVLNKIETEILNWVCEFKSVCDCSSEYHRTSLNTLRQ